MGWICRHCGAENDYAVTVCPVCEHLYGSRTRFSQEHRLERIDRMLYRLPERSIHAVRVNRGLSLILAVLLVICVVSIFTSRPALSDGSGALLPRMQQRLSALGQVVSNRISNGNARAAAGFVRAGETVRRRTGSLQGTSSDGSPAGQLPAERAGQLQLVAEHLSSRWQSGIWTIDRKGRVLAWTLRSRFGQMQTGFENMMPKLADGWNNLLDSLRIGNIWKWVTGLFSPA